jgi:hypothetical protein
MKTILAIALGCCASIAQAQYCAPGSTCALAQQESARNASAGLRTTLFGRTVMRSGGHPGGVLPGSRFVGTGFSTDPNNIPTCEPAGGGELVADQVVPTYDKRRKTTVYFRTRAWK